MMEKPQQPGESGQSPYVPFIDGRFIIDYGSPVGSERGYHIDQDNLRSVGRASSEITAPGGGPIEATGNTESNETAEPVDSTPTAEAPTKHTLALPAEAAAPQPVTFPVNVRELIDTALIPSGLTGNESEKFFVKDHPALLVHRCEPGDHREFVQANKLTQRLNGYGVHVPPVRTLMHGDASFAVTQHVTGDPLQELWVAERTPELVREVDTLFSNLGTWLLEEKSEDRDTVMNVSDLGHYRKGTIAGNPESHLWLANIPEYVSGDTSYAFDVAQLTNSLLEAEGDTGYAVRLEAGRAAVARAVELLPLITRHANEYTDTIMSALASSMPIDEPDMPQGF
jgi:hypothetical protein